MTNTKINSITQMNDTGNEIQRIHLQRGDGKLFIKSNQQSVG